MKYFINGLEVNEYTFERDEEDNYSAGIEYKTWTDGQGNRYMTYEIEELSAGDKLGEIQEWLNTVKDELENESISYSELAQIDQIHDRVKIFLAENHGESS